MRSQHHVVRAGVALVSAATFASAASGIAWAHGPGNQNTKHGHPNHGHGHKGALYVSPTGKSGAADRNCGSAAYSTVQSAVDAASAGSTVIVCRGAYTEDVIISAPLTLAGQHGAVIHGSPTANGNCDQLGPGGPGTAPCLAGITIKSGHVKVQGLTVTGAIGEGILATGSPAPAGGSIQDVVIEGNRVVGNDTGGIPPTTKSPYPQCVEVGQIPGDCGEGIHLMGAFDSTVRGNFVSGNSGGVLLTDEFGPTHDNVIDHNTITNNAFDCGVTAPGHNPTALDSSGNPQPSKAGVYDNVIEHNRITNNGLKGEGAGVLFANAGPGTASYNNLVVHNYIAGNELSGVTMHAHTLGPGQFEDLSGNRILHNTIGKNNTGGDPLDGTAKDPSTTGILVFSGTVPVNVTIAHNRIRNNQYGVWLGVGGHVTATLKHNVFQQVTTPVLTSP
ncbi:MAG TPA: right-handed parallel beta-helix repeat-containing protein [Solirubrobacteraceae bacterium]